MKFTRNAIEAKQRELSSQPRRMTMKVTFIGVKILLFLLVFAVVGLGCLALGMASSIIETAPSVDDISIAPSDYPTKVLDTDGNVIETFVTTGSNRESVSISELPEHLLWAFIDLEDERFYEHNGIDMKGIIRAGYIAITTLDFSQGASTITQQLLKNNVFTTWTDSQTYGSLFKRKLQEQYLALQVEETLSKSQILEYYLNTINLGSNTLGVQAAAKRYFGKDAADLTISESAVIASITQNPTAYNPITYPENNAKRRATCLEYMYENGHITKEEYDEALADDVYSRIQQNDISTTSTSSAYSYFVDALYEQVIDDLMEQKGYTATQASNAVYSGGLTIMSTQDSAVQEIVDSVINDDSYYPATQYSFSWSYSVEHADGTTENYGEYSITYYHKTLLGETTFKLIFDSTEEIDELVEEYKEAQWQEGDTVLGESITYTLQPQASFVVMDQTTGYVLALSGGRGEKTASLSYNRATQATRQPGSTFKILSTYAAALDTAGYTLATVVKDEEYYYANGRAVTNSGGGHLGNITVREAIYRSNNVVAVKVFTDITPQLGYDYLLDFGITTLVESRVSGDEVLTDIQQATALGGITDGVTNLEMTAAYATIADGGLYHTPTLYTVVYDYNGNILLDNTTTATKQVIKESTAYLLTSAMEDVVENAHGTGKLCALDNMTVAGKTGTTSNTYDVWFCGYTPYLTASIWTGYDENTSLGDASYHKYMWRDIMQQIHDYYGYEDKDFEVPDSIVECTVCSTSGDLANSGCSSTFTEYYASGTEPTATCTVHTAVSNKTETTTVAAENEDDAEEEDAGADAEEEEDADAVTTTAETTTEAAENGDTGEEEVTAATTQAEEGGDADTEE
ncbi:MAG: transglycosylase domain-containing protein [Lachnospiraceae bacterium]|nr:transglycosylase domain-containing protein [Lachnospiraceae bacterium]